VAGAPEQRQRVRVDVTMLPPVCGMQARLCNAH
jgi:hypothetical protein